MEVQYSSSNKSEEVKAKQPSEDSVDKHPQEKRNFYLVNPNKKELKGPSNNQIEFERLLFAKSHNDCEILSQTTLMIKNIPIKFNHDCILDIINRKFAEKFDFFYLPKDLRTQQGVGFAFINMISPMHIIEFYLEFHLIKWSEYVQNCNSNKYCQIIYANM